MNPCAIYNIVPAADLPRCAVCNKPVDSLESSTSPAGETVLLVAYCHGATEGVEIERELFLAFDSVGMGDAFAGAPALPGRRAP